MMAEVPITVPKLKVLLTGGTGYIGGAVLTSLLRSPDFEVTTLVRSPAQAETLTSPSTNPKFFTGSTPNCVLGDLSDTDLLRKLASEADIVVNCASAEDLAAAEALIEGLSLNPNGKKIFVHTSGTSAVATYNDGNEGGEPFDDAKDNLLQVMKEWNEKEEYAHRTVTIRIVEYGKEKGVGTYVIIPPTIYGTSAALISRLSIQLPLIIRRALESGLTRFIGSGAAVWSNVHVTDLSNLYEIIIRCALSGVAKSGEEGLYFASNGEMSWKDVAYGVKEAVEAIEGWSKGKVGVESYTVEEATDILGVGEVRNAKLAFGSNVITAPTKALELGWKPVFGGDQAVIESMKKDAAIIWKQVKGE